MQHSVPVTEANLVFATPRKLPRASELVGRVVVLDLAFASEASRGGFEKVTLRFIEELGPRLAAWVDHHDHVEHARFHNDSRFVLATKAQHGACPEMITPELVGRVGRVQTVVCHTDFDGLASTAKWLRGGHEPYLGCDADARAIDTRIGTPSHMAETVDRALRARPRDHALMGVVVRYLTEIAGRAGADKTGGATGLWQLIEEAADELRPVEAATRRLALGYERLHPGVAMVDITGRRTRVDKTLLLMLGQERETVAMVVDGDTVTVAVAFDAGVDLLEKAGLSGGMPTRVSVHRDRLAQLCAGLGVSMADLAEHLQSKEDESG